MAGEKGKAQPKHSTEEKLAIGELICQMYESQQCTIESCCDANEVTYRTFHLWCAELSELSDRYKKAKQKQDADFWENIIKPLSKRALQRHLESETTQKEIELAFQGVKTGDTQITKDQVLPNPTVTIFALKGLYPEKFVPATEATVTINDQSEFSKLPLEKRLAILKIINDGNADPATNTEVE